MHLIFHSGVMESSIGKTINDKYITLGFVKPLFELFEVLFFSEFEAGQMRQPQTNPERFIGRELLFDSRNVFTQCCEMILPALFGVCEFYKSVIELLELLNPLIQ